MSNKRTTFSSEQQRARPQRSVVRTGLEQARIDFLSLLEAIPDEAWNLKGLNSAWRIKEEMWHIAWGMAFLLTLIGNARRRVGLPIPLLGLADQLNILYTRMRATLATRASIAKRYNRTYTAVLDVLDNIGDDEWHVEVSVFGKKHSVAELFAGIPHHQEEHVARIRPVIHQIESQKHWTPLDRDSR